MSVLSHLGITCSYPTLTGRTSGRTSRREAPSTTVTKDQQSLELPEELGEDETTSSEPEPERDDIEPAPTITESGSVIDGTAQPQAVGERANLAKIATNAHISLYRYHTSSSTSH